LAAYVKHTPSHCANDLDLPSEKLNLGAAPGPIDDYDENAQSVVGVSGTQRNDFAGGRRIAPHQSIRVGDSRTFDIPIDQLIQACVEVAIPLLRVR
jgi:hypothetical protein